jgi:bla regulator protein BlaR1
MIPASISAWGAIAAPIANHLWQSTVFAVVAGLLTLTLTRHRAHLRYSLWLAASVKFLVPFGALVTLGRHVGWPTSIRVQPDMTLVLDAVSQPFSRSALRVAAATSPATAVPGVGGLLVLLLAVWSLVCAVILLTWWMRWRRLAVVIREASPVQDGRELETLRRLERIIGTASPVAMVSSNTSFEPGVFGLVHPVLLWPRSVGERLGDRQVEAILAHELAHVRRRDNLAAAVHMVVEVLFWFHPLVWWLGTRLVDEREQACDEEVVRWGSEPQVYAESILKICELYAEVPLACVAGVTGSDLRKRIERIMKNDAHRATLNAWRKILVATAGVVAIAGPIALGALNAPRLRAQSLAVDPGVPAFAAVSIKEHTSGDPGVYPITTGPDGTSVWKNVTLRVLLRTAYQLSLLGGPDWLSTDRFDIETKPKGPFTEAQWPLMWRKLLADRFNLIVHIDTRIAPVYALVLARSDGTLGPQIRQSACVGKETAPIPGPLDPKNPPPLPCGAARSRPGTLAARWQTMEEATQMLSLMLGRKVVNRTGLTEKYDLNAEWTPAPGPPGPQAFGVGPATFTAIEEQLGLKLESEQGTVDTLVIDHVDRPIADAAAAGGSGLGFGLSTGGGPGTGSTLDVADFCCPQYVALMLERIRSGWTQQAEVTGTVVIKFTVERDGRITQTSVERTSGYETLDLAARNAVAITQLPPLPQEFSNPTLTVHLNFQYRR